MYLPVKNRTALKHMGKILTGNEPGRPRSFCVEEALAAAMRVFAAKGYEGASLSDLTEAMGINRPSLYAAFGNKDSLFRQAMDQYVQAAAEHVAECLSAPTAREGVERLLREGVARWTDPEWPGLCFVTQMPLDEAGASIETRLDMAEKRAIVEQALKRRMAQALADGELPRSASADDLARFYFVMIQGLALQAQHGCAAEELLRVVDVAMQRWPAREMVVA
jgi:AcrR family transcriptional regulator